MIVRFTALAGLLLLGACAADAQAPAATTPAAAAATPPAAAAAPGVQTAVSRAEAGGATWNVEKISCAELLAADDEDRAAVEMFYYGYMTAKSRNRMVDTSKIGPDLRKVTETCIANPKLAVPAAFAKALASLRR